MRRPLVRYAGVTACLLNICKYENTSDSVHCPVVNTELFIVTPLSLCVMIKEDWNFWQGIPCNNCHSRTWWTALALFFVCLFLNTVVMIGKVMHTSLVTLQMAAIVTVSVWCCYGLRELFTNPSRFFYRYFFYFAREVSAIQLDAQKNILMKTQQR